jgi:hypothetical protein
MDWTPSPSRTPSDATGAPRLRGRGPEGREPCAARARVRGARHPRRRSAAGTPRGDDPSRGASGRPSAAEAPQDDDPRRTPAADRCLGPCAGAGERIRTADLRITSALLYQLSYTSSNREERWCRPAESNCGHTDFQSVALPTELGRHVSSVGDSSNAPASSQARGVRGSRRVPPDVGRPRSPSAALGRTRRAVPSRASRGILPGTSAPTSTQPRSCP